MNALITGGARRVGAGIALALARAGYDVLIHYRSSADEAEQVANQCRALGVQAHTVQADLATVEGCRAVVDAVPWSQLDVLVNNASAFEPRAFAETDLDHWDAMLAINLRAPFLLARDLLDRLTGSTVVNLCDIGADRPLVGYTAYSVSKAGLVMLTRSMAVELAPRVRTVGIAPGQVAWPEDYDDAKRQRLLKRIPMNRVGTPADVGQLVVFLATATYLNGVVVPVDGGLHARY